MKQYKYTINGNKYEVAIGDITDNIATLTVNGEEFKVEMEREAEPEKKKPVVRPAAASANSSEGGASAADNSVASKANALKAPLPGVITDILVEVGQEVSAGDNVIVLEAMKMANNLQAEKSGKVTAICVQVGQSVMEDEALVVIE